MAKLIVLTPVPGVNDDVGRVHFSNGVAEIDDTVHAAELNYMRNAGYIIREPDETAEEPAVDDPQPAAEAGDKPKKTAPVAEWRAYAVTQGLSVEEADALTKNQLVERFASDESEES
jgi:hypothetical protein